MLMKSYILSLTRNVLIHTIFLLNSIKHIHSLRAGHHAVELLVVDLPVAVDVGLLDHGLDLLHRQLLAQVHHDDRQLLSVDVAVAVLTRTRILR